MTKNGQTTKRYKGTVRILKSLRNFMEESRVPAAKPIPGFLLECMVWNVPNDKFEHYTWENRVKAVLAFLWEGTKADSTCASWTEVSGLKYLFHASQKWTREQAHEFVAAAWVFLGYGS